MTSTSESTAPPALTPKYVRGWVGGGFWISDISFRTPGCLRGASLPALLRVKGRRRWTAAHLVVKVWSSATSVFLCLRRRRGDGGRPQNQEVTGLLPVPPTVWAQVDFVDVAKQQSPAGIVFERVSLKR